MSFRKTYIVICLSGFFIQNAWAQMEPRIMLDVMASPAADFSDTTGQFQSNRFSLGLSLPLYGKIKNKGKGKPSLWAMLLNGAFEAQLNEIGDFDDSRRFNNPWVGTSLIHFNGGKSMFLFNVRLRWRYDEVGESDRSFFPDGLFMWRYQKSERFAFLTGLSYNYNFGAGFPFPILGFNLNFKNNAQLNVILPLAIDYKKQTRKNHAYSIFLRPDGDIASFSNNNVFPEQSEQDIFFQQRNLKLGFRYMWPVSFLRIEPEVGMLLGRQVSFSGSNGNLFDPETIYESGLSNAPYLRLKLSFLLKKNKSGDGGAGGFGTEFMGL